MFTKKITDSDAFIEMSSAAQALYFHLNQGADDDGFNNQVQMAMYKSHASIDDLKVLLAKNNIIRFESGVIVIKHWRMHNTLRKDRYTPTNFQEELAQLGLKDNGSYTLGCQVVAKRLPQVSIGEVSVVEDSLNTTTTTDEPPMLTEVYLYFKDFVEDAINEAEKFHAYNANKGWSCLPDWKAAADLWIARIKDHKVGK
jgi:hypothetical protein